MTRRARTRLAFTLVELLIVIGIIALLLACLLPALSRIRKSTLESKLRSDDACAYRAAATIQNSLSDMPQQPAPPPPPHAAVTSFVAKVNLTPRLSVGTAQPESIYEANFTAKIFAHAPTLPPAGEASQTCELHLPLPPQIISLADLNITINGAPTDSVTLRDADLVWTGPLPTTPTPVEVTYAAVGKGLYALQTPPGKILDTFELQLVANGSDVRMLELSLQPTSLARSAGQTTYTWDYKRLMFGRPIQLDVLGIAPIDRLGELRWLGPLSVVAFGVLVGLYVHAHRLARFDRWMLLLVLGAFTGAYPLMYFAQEFVSLQMAVAISAGLVFGLIAARSIVIVGFRHAVLGVLLPAAGSMSLALVAATQPNLQGLLLTSSAILLFLTLMTLLPRLQPSPSVQPAV